MEIAPARRATLSLHPCRITIPGDSRFRKNSGHSPRGFRRCLPRGFDSSAPASLPFPPHGRCRYHHRLRNHHHRHLHLPLARRVIRVPLRSSTRSFISTLSNSNDPWAHRVVHNLTPIRNVTFFHSPSAFPRLDSPNCGYDAEERWQAVNSSAATHGVASSPSGRRLSGPGNRCCHTFIVVRFLFECIEQVAAWRVFSWRGRCEERVTRSMKK